MDDQYISVINAAGGTMEFSAFVDACRAAKIDPRLWVRVKHAGKLFTWIDASGVHHISTSPQPAPQQA